MRGNSHVRCAPCGASLYPRCNREELEGRFLGRLAYLDGKPVRGQEHARKAVIVWRRPGRGTARPARYGQGWIA